jgi:hypothetical protein
MVSDEDQLPNQPSGWRPVPDPTTLTNELVSKAVAALREIIETRLNANDKAVKLLETRQELIPQQIKDEVAHLRQLHDEKFSAIIEAIDVFKDTVNGRFSLGDVQTDKAARDVKSAVDAAFAAAKEAVGEQNKSNALSITKSETAFTKQIDQLSESVRLVVKNTDDKIADLKDRLVAMEGRSSVADPATASAIAKLAEVVGAVKTRTDEGSGAHQQKNETSAWIFAVIGGAAGIGAMLFEIFSALHR